MTLKAFFPVLGFAAGMGIAAAGATSAQAATITFSDSVTSNQSNGIASIQKFDTSLGTLNFVTIDYDLRVRFDVGYRNTGSTEQTATIDETFLVLVGHHPELAVSDILFEQTIGGDFAIAPARIVPRLTTVSLGFDFQERYDSRGERINSLFTRGDFDPTLYTGTGTFDFNFSAVNGLLSFSGFLPSNTVVPPTVGGTVSVTYDFAEAIIAPPSTVPVPAALPLLAFALGAIGLSARRKRTV